VVRPKSPRTKPPKRAKHLSVHMPKEAAEAFEALLEHIRQQTAETNPTAKVSESSVVVMLVLGEVKKRGIRR
jgi:hypothetical protein